MMPLDQQLDYARRLVPGAIVGVVDWSDLDDRAHCGIRIDAFTIIHLPIEVERKSILGTRKVKVDGFSVDVHVGDGEVAELGVFENFFEVIETVACMLVKDRIKAFAEAEGMFEAWMESKALMGPQ